MAKTYPLNTSNPAGGSAPRLGDDYIRTLALAVKELLAVDHYMGPASPYTLDAAGQHAKVKFQSGLSGTAVASQTLYASLDAAGLPLAYKDFSGTICVITSGSRLILNSGNLSHGASIQCSNTAIISASGTVAVLADGAQLASDAAPLSGSAAIANTKYVDDQISANDMDPADLTTGTTGFAGFAADTASSATVIIHANGLKEVFGYHKKTGATGTEESINLTAFGFTRVLPGASVTAYSKTTPASAASASITDLTATSLKFICQWGLYVYDGVFYRVAGYTEAS